MDLQQLKVQDEGRRMDLRHPATGQVLTYGDNDEKIMYLVIGSSDCEKYRRSQRKILDKRLKQQQKFRQSRLTAAQLEEEAIISLAEVTFDGRVFMNGEELTITPGKVAVNLYTCYDWIREQANEFLEDRSNFLEN